MKIKENKKVWFIVAVIVIIGYIGLCIYQIINKDFDPMHLVIILLVIESLMNCIEKK